MKRSGRIAAIINMLTDEPNRLFSLDYFCQKFGVSKSTISEDLSIAKESLFEMNLGIIITVSGPSGGVLFKSIVTNEQCSAIQSELCYKIQDSNRILGGGLLYTSDLMFNPSLVSKMANIFAHIFSNYQVDYVVTIETKGIPLALMTANLLNIPAIVVRREPKISEGPTISINYFSGSAGKMQKMSVAKRAVKPGSKAVIIDDFMRAGGSIKGINELLSELDVEVLGIGVAMATTTPSEKKVANYIPLIYIDQIDEKKSIIKAHANKLIHKNI